MTTFWIVSILIFAVVTFLLAKLTLKKSIQESGEKMWKTFGTRTHYWKLLFLCSFGVTAVVVLFLKWTHVLVVSS
ncbi:hypothetical protein [Flavobacterium capsici]|uniref:Uncharacterized protein n=1 Tax=Flavobacterium capsici TaxID=3075618 RepID=A0AA96F333_9FLAO|nr:MULTISPECIES: hypothetical protein [unclassified Flavobacterium]WNM20325.1 hypothetical protein RN608_06505 [Flavobacterium sp. PMR2A8]WNM21715.1 hypothetical protein RN605_13675 [Flavobacterium sp. PMTSA4]